MKIISNPNSNPHSEYKYSKSGLLYKLPLPSSSIPSSNAPPSSISSSFLPTSSKKAPSRSPISRCPLPTSSTNSSHSNQKPHSSLPTVSVKFWSGICVKKETPVFIKKMKVREKEYVEAFSRMLSFIKETDLCNPNTKVLEILDQWIDTKKRSFFIIYEKKELKLRFLGNTVGGRKEEGLRGRGGASGEGRVEGGGGEVRGGGGEVRVGGGGGGEVRGGRGGGERERERDGGRRKASEAEEEGKEIKDGKEKKLGALEAVNIILCLTRTLKNLEESNDLKKLDWEYAGKISLMSVFESPNDGFFFDLYNFEIVPKKDKQLFIFSYLSLIKQLNASVNNPLLTILRKGLKEKRDWTFAFSFPLFSFEKQNLSKQWSNYYQINKKSLSNKKNNRETTEKEVEKQEDIDEENRRNKEEERRKNEKNYKITIESTVKNLFLEKLNKKVEGKKEEELIKEEHKSQKEEKKEGLAKKLLLGNDSYDGEKTTMVLKKISSVNSGGENKKIIVDKGKETVCEEGVKKRKDEGKIYDQSMDNGEEGKKKRKDEGKISDQSMEKDDLKKKKKEEVGKLEEIVKDEKEERRKRGKEGGSEREKDDEEEKEKGKKKERKHILKSKKKELQTLIKEINTNQKDEKIFTLLIDYCQVCKDLLTNYKSKEFKKWGEDFKSRLSMGLRVATLLLMEKKTGKREELQFLLKNLT